MAELATRAANIRLTNEDGRVICSVSNVSPAVNAETAAGFVSAIATIYNNGSCNARMNVVYDILTP